MSIVVETGTGLSNADSYGELADVDAYNEAYAYSQAWRKLAGAGRERAARQATQFLDLNYGAHFKGTRVSETQSLAWPRTGVTDRDGFAVSSTSIPACLKQAFYELCIRASIAELMPDISAEDGGTLLESEIRVGAVFERLVYSGGQAQTDQFRRVDAMLKPITVNLDRIERG